MSPSKKTFFPVNKAFFFYKKSVKSSKIKEFTGYKSYFLSTSGEVMACTTPFKQKNIEVMCFGDNSRFV